jgi:hypothetical protein
MILMLIDFAKKTTSRHGRHGGVTNKKVDSGKESTFLLSGMSD